MTSVLVVCGAGASSTFLVHRMRVVASERRTQLTIVAGAVADLATRLPGVDLVLVGHHLEPMFPEISAAAEKAGTVAALLPLLGYDTAGAALALDVAASALRHARPVPRSTPSKNRRTSMAEQTVVVASVHGLHARPASLFTQAAAKSGLAVKLAKAGKAVNAASILGVISLGIEHNDEVTLTADGADADAVITELAGILSTDHDA